MNRTASFVSRALVATLCVTAIAASTVRDAAAQYGALPPPPPPPQYVAPPPAPAPVYIAPPPPPDAYVATSTPEYFEGRPVYFYNGSWFFRDERGAWTYYRHEPDYLRDRRAHWGEHRQENRYHYNR